MSGRAQLDGLARRALELVAARSEGPPLSSDQRVTVNFHPDRFVDGRSVLAALAEDGRYRSQFETGISNGGLTAFAGGDRWNSEQRIFGGAYDDAAPQTRPVYGALNHRDRAVGGSHRFGSAHLRLRAHVLQRTTFCYPDSHLEPTDFGVAGECDLLALATERDRSSTPPDVLDDYIEAQVHGGVVITRDVDAVVLDPAYRGTTIEAWADRLGCAVEWHRGFELAVSALDRHRAYRGPEFTDLASRMARGGRLTPPMIGQASQSGTDDDQALKRVWHILARFGLA